MDLDEMPIGGAHELEGGQMGAKAISRPLIVLVLMVGCGTGSVVEASQVQDFASDAISAGFDFEYELRVGPRSSAPVKSIVGTWDGDRVYAEWESGRDKEDPADFVIVDDTIYHRSSFPDPGTDERGGSIELEGIPEGEESFSHTCMGSNANAENNARALLGAALESRTSAASGDRYEFEFDATLAEEDRKVSGQGVAEVREGTLRELVWESTGGDPHGRIFHGVMSLTNVGDPERIDLIDMGELGPC